MRWIIGITAVVIIVFGGVLFFSNYGSPFSRYDNRLARLERTVADMQRPGPVPKPVDTETLHKVDSNLLFLLRGQESPWVGMPGAPVQSRFTVEHDVIKRGGPVRLLAEVRNNSDKEITVSTVRLLPFTVHLTLGGEALGYLGPRIRIAPPNPITLPPGRMMRDVIELSTLEYPRLAKAGNFAAEWSYDSGGSRGGITWSGQLPPVKVTWRAE